MDLEDVLQKTEERVMSGLKDFQTATVERVAELYKNHQNRVLIADEVGLGKTLVARGVIAKLAQLRFLTENDDFFKVVYVCSNQNIANQNIQKLNVFGADQDRAFETRLSMQHLKITEQETQKMNQPVQFIPLTPDTSFRLSSGPGSVNERALMFAVLRRIPELKEYEKELEEILVCQAKRSWDWQKSWYEKRVSDCEKNTAGNVHPYPQNIIDEIHHHENYQQILFRLEEQLRYNTRTNRTNDTGSRKIVSELRLMFAQISVDMLKPDFVIMDEFQRFRFLIQNRDERTETGLVVNRILWQNDIRVLLLSATPYKLYSTLEEIEENNVDDHYEEFFEVMNFLMNDHKKCEDFREIWSDYSNALHEVTVGNTTILSMKQKKAEDALYEAVCRTERISVMEGGDYTDDKEGVKQLKICEADVRSYIEMEEVLDCIVPRRSLPVDYVKSCPYLLSFMRDYQAKKIIEKYFRGREQEIKKTNKKTLWLDRKKVNSYEKLPPANAKLEDLKRQVFQNRSELYLWVPPSRPYYEMQGVYRNSSGFSKFLVFSSWEMVPRMIGGLISYEAERLTVGALGNRAKNEDKKNTEYFARRRFPYSRMTFRETEDRPATMALLCMIYPSKTLAGLYNPIDCINAGMNLAAIESMLRRILEDKITSLSIQYSLDPYGREDERWYYLAPVLMDGAFATDWINDNLRSNTNDDEITGKRGSKSLRHHLECLKEMLADVSLGRPPEDLIQVLINMTLGSPAVCIYRSNGNNAKRATELAKIFLSVFNQTEATAIVELAYERRKDDNYHWQAVLQYCKDGNFQAMFDEYMHLMSEEIECDTEEGKSQKVHDAMAEALKIHAASYDFDTYSDFHARMVEEGKGRKSCRLRSHFAVGFLKSDGNDGKNANRKESVRSSFNSPLRPFVLATTSIGQEGLDFHNYCRKVVHWNLPSNPVDLEQREGRVNRYKCLAIRQNVAQQYGNLEFKKDIWNEMFDAAAEADKKQGQSDLIPYWCFGENQKIKIERIVPMYPFSKDEEAYNRLIKILSLYRLTLGQARQEELLDYLFRGFGNGDELKQFIMNLSPFSRHSSEQFG